MAREDVMPKGIYKRKPSGDKPQAADAKAGARKAPRKVAPAPAIDFSRSRRKTKPGVLVPAHMVEVPEPLHSWLVVSAEAIGCKPSQLLEHVIRQYLRSTLAGGLT
jgi:hypothetical protein